ncbi:MAG: SDR family NAD(P)-dependent oxidoreductase [Spirochaetaceae bacterium]
MDATSYQFDDSHVVVVTGGGSGIGLAIARTFDALGATVVIAGRREDVLNEAAAGMSGRTRPMPLDVTDLPSIDPWVDALTTVLGPVRTLINNAGKHQKKPAIEVSDDDFDDILQTHLKGAFALSRSVARRLSAQKLTGDIQFISSMAALYGIPYVTSYSAAKTAMVGLVRQLAVEWGPLGIRVNSVAPGFIETAMSHKALGNDPERKKKILGRTPMGRLGSPDEVGGVCAFLASKAASYVNGTIIPVDGGNSVGF